MEERDNETEDVRVWARRVAEGEGGAAHPGAILLRDFMEPHGLTAYRLAVDIGVSPPLIAGILAGKQGITGHVALLLAAYFGTSPLYWVRLQGAYDITVAARRMATELEKVPHVEWNEALKALHQTRQESEQRPKRLYRKRKP